ncbi:hypothetical protein AVEN_231284-1 [Araneus ventricosus]|uniref:Uncharacterized protein n=1 Tax=Araneus ventricosus TaxID=182803 RepID=A0A4Y2CIR2_ARAVE|nr:hypothetical protein AVEN_231284-1 [Araneus ventricosus]
MSCLPVGKFLAPPLHRKAFYELPHQQGLNDKSAKAFPRKPFRKPLPQGTFPLAGASEKSPNNVEFRQIPYNHSLGDLAHVWFTIGEISAWLTENRFALGCSQLATFATA